MMWRHVVISTRRSWLHGDGRGFRSRGHRIHSSGDYKNPPPQGEHEALHKYHKERAKGPAIVIERHLRAEVGKALLRAILESGHAVLVIAVKGKHTHILTELPALKRRAQLIVGKWKSARTSALRRELPGPIWGEGGKYKAVKDRRHLARVYKYIRDDQGPGAWVWTYRQGVPQDVLDELEKRCRDRERDRARKALRRPKPRAQRSGPGF
jgi:hypothetical protein